MSRDFTPRQQHFADVGCNYALSSSKLVMNFQGVESVLRDPEGTFEKKYPHLSFLFERAHSLYRSMEENVNTEPVFNKYEKALASIIKEDDEGQLDLTGEKNVLLQWYLGELDPNFYYHEQNDEIFYEAMKKDILCGSKEA